MDEELRAAIEAAKEQQPVAISLEWYQGTVKLTDIKQYIRANINSASRSFVAIGYYLKHIRDNELFTEDGYQSIWEFAQSEFGISKSSSSRFMAINDRFSKDGNSPVLLDRYKDFSSSKLSEMLTMTDEQMEQVTIATTRAEIRELKQPVKEEVVAPAQQEMDQKSPLGYSKSIYPPNSLIASKGCGNKHTCFSCSRICEIRQEGRYCVDAPMGHPYSCTTMNILDSIENDMGGDCMFINLELAYHRAGDHEPSPCCKECKNKCGYACRKAAHEPKSDDLPETVNDTHENVDNQPEIVNDVDEQDSWYEDSEKCTRCKWSDVPPDNVPGGGELPCLDCMELTGEESDPDKFEPIEPNENVIKTSESVIEEPESVIATNVFDCRCDTCGHEVQGCCEYDTKDDYCVLGNKWVTKTDPVEIVEADIIETVPAEPQKPIFSAKYHLKEAIKREEEQLDQLGDTWRVKQPDTFLKHQTILLALKCYLTDLEYPVPEPAKPVQPELPLFKNNDQRKEWAENYKAWGEWYHDQNIDCRYYKYDFPNGDRLVVEEYRERERYWADDTKDEQFYHLLLKKKQAYGGKRTYEEKFSHQTSSMTEIVEFLKVLQRKGA